jgi:prepilin-type N-terminal cleavage/methylation domain-containing protein
MHKMRGFTILELMIATAIFLVLCAAMFGLLQLSQQKYTSESQMTGAFQETRLAIDQIVRDFNVSGYPALSLFSTVPADSSKYAVSPVAWDPNYAVTSCVVASTCFTPGNFDLIIETDLGSGVSWIRYELIGTTLYRAIVAKTPGGDPIAATSAPGVMVPFLTNVMNNVQATQPALFAEIAAAYPAMFPGGNPQPVFVFTCDSPAGPQPCATAGNSAIPTNIRDVDITLIVATRHPDMQTLLPKIVELAGRGQRVNPSN